MTMQTVIKASAFDRAMKLEAELNRIHGRIIKLLDSIKGYEMESRRLRLKSGNIILQSRNFREHTTSTLKQERSTTKRKSRTIGNMK